jgi:hypothetical protein
MSDKDSVNDVQMVDQDESEQAYDHGEGIMLGGAKKLVEVCFTTSMLGVISTRS